MRDTVVTRVPLKRGLDLQGGMHLALELDQSKQVSADPKRDLDLALTVLRKRIDEFGVEEPLVQKAGDDRIVVELAGITEPGRAKAIVQRSAFLEFRITDKTNALEKALPAMDRTLRGLGIKGDTTTGKPSAVEQLLGGDSAKKAAADPGSRRRRPGKTGGKTAKDSKAPRTAAPRTAPPPTRPRRRRRRPGRTDSARGRGRRAEYAGRVRRARAGLPAGGQPASTSRPWPGSSRAAWCSAGRRRRPASGCSRTASSTSLDDRPIVTGSNLEDAQATIDQLTQGAIVTFQLDRAGGRKFGDETGRHVGDFMAILLDGRVQGRPPVIQSRIGRNGQITLGNKSLQEAQDLALTLKAGALPIPLKIVEERQVGASLGSDSIKDGHHGRRSSAPRSSS